MSEDELTDWSYTGELKIIDSMNNIVYENKIYKQKCYDGIDKYLYPVLNNLIISFI